MKKIIIIPDSFKGTMSSKKVCSIIEKAIKEIIPYSKTISIPVADGGEGTVEAYLSSCGGEISYCEVSGPYKEKTKAFIGYIDDGSCAVIELASCAGIVLRKENHNIEQTTTFGVGELIKLALDSDVKKIILGIGGSLTNDAGCGIATSLGTKFFDKQGKEFLPLSGSLQEVSRIDNTNVDKRIKDIELITMCDINNPLFGENGASYVFSPQKGASKEQVEKLDKGLQHLSEIVARDIGFDDPYFAGAGASGGVGYGMKCFLGSKIQMGIDTLLETINFESLLQDCDLIISGEGKLDTQSLSGKVVIGIAKYAKKNNVPLVSIVGTMEGDLQKAYEKGIFAAFSTNRYSLPFEKAKLRCEEDLYLTTRDVIKMFSL